MVELLLTQLHGALRFGRNLSRALASRAEPAIRIGSSSMAHGTGLGDYAGSEIHMYPFYAVVVNCGNETLQLS